MKECVVVCTYRRPEMLESCLQRIAAYHPYTSDLFVFADRGEMEGLADITFKYGAKLIVQPAHNYFGNSFSAGEALRFVYNSGYDLIHYIEDDCFIKPGFFQWTRAVHDDWDDIFCSCGWVFNRFMPLLDETYFAPWIYIPQFTIRRQKLDLVMKHLNPLYYGDQLGYLDKNMPKNLIDDMYPEMVHHEIDGMLQRLLMHHRMQVAWSAISKVKHVGFAGYNRGGYTAYEDFFTDCKNFEDRVERIEEFAADPYWRMQFFDPKIVEREEGREFPIRTFRYRVTVGEWESEFDSNLLPHQLKTLRTVNSVPVTPDTRFVLA